MGSLKDQLLKAGLATEQSVKKVKKQQKKQQKQQQQAGKKKKAKVASSATLQAQKAMLKKHKRDKELNQQRQQEAQQKALHSQVKQLVSSSQLDRTEGEVAYHFTDQKKVKKIHITAEQQTQLSLGQIAIIKLSEDDYQLVPQKAAEKIAERDASYVVATESEKNSGQNAEQDDPYADYQVPDDLVW